MFGDFKYRRDGDAQRRLSASLLVAGLLVAGLAIAAVATAATPTVAPPPPVEIPVELLPPPEEPEPEPEEAPPPSPAPPAPNPRRPRVAPPEIVEPTEISDEELEESDGDLVNEGSGGGRGRAAPTPEPEPEPEPEPQPERPRPPPGPIQLPENGRPAARLGEPPSLDYPEAARSAGIQGLVLVRCAIPTDGHPRDCRALRGPAELRDAAIAWAERNRFTAAALEDGTPVATWKVLPVVFRLTNI